jgi:hypothetical protein
MSGAVTSSIPNPLNFEGLTAQVSKDAEMAGIYRQLLQEELDRRFKSVDRLIDNLQQRLDERFNGQNELRLTERDALKEQFAALQAMLTERSLAQKEAVTAALTAADRAVQAALISAEKAVNKAEDAAGERFKAVNEFRQTLTDQAATFLTRAEYDAAHKAVDDRINANADRVAALELRLTSRLDRGEGSDSGAATTRTEQRLNLSQVIAAVAVLVAIASVIVLVIRKLPVFPILRETGAHPGSSEQRT